jgi:hypothetical protein
MHVQYFFEKLISFEKRPAPKVLEAQAPIQFRTPDPHLKTATSDQACANFSHRFHRLPTLPSLNYRPSVIRRQLVSCHA